jgi:AcrR family transcriptional regulator
MRGIARAAGVDAALVHHYFGTKEELYLASLALPYDPRTLLAPIADGGIAGAGERLVRIFLSIWDQPDTRLPMLTLVRGVFDPDGHRILRDGFLPVVLTPLGAALGVSQPERRMALVASQMFGLAILRYVVELEPLASMSSDELVAWYGPTVQRYLTDELARP